MHVATTAITTTATATTTTAAMLGATACSHLTIDIVSELLERAESSLHAPVLYHIEGGGEVLRKASNELEPNLVSASTQ